MSKQLFYCGICAPDEALGESEGHDWLLLWSETFYGVEDVFLETTSRTVNEATRGLLCSYSVDRVLDQYGSSGVAAILSEPVMRAAMSYYLEESSYRFSQLLNRTLEKVNMRMR